MKTKAKYGGVNLRDRSGKLYLDFRFNGQRYQPSLGMVTNPTNKSVAKQIASQIELDIALGTFTGDIKRYLNKPDETTATDKPVDYSPNDVWERYRIENGFNSELYELITRFFKRTRPTWGNLEKAIASQQWSTTTHNRYVKVMNNAFVWGKDSLGSQYLRIPTIKATKVNKEDRKPFTDDEIKLILDAIESNQFCNPKSAYKHSHYLPLVRFVFLTGVRMGEAVGLKVKHIDTVNGTVTISESLSKKGNLDNRRVQKSTKTGSVRVLPIPTSELNRIIKGFAGKKPDDYVFTGFRGKPIDQDNFRARVWKPVLHGLGIPYRVPYAARHTMASRAIEQGIPLTGIAYLMGHSDTTMVMKQYGHMINRPNLPSINLSA